MLLSHTVAADLTAIMTHNRQARARRETRQQLARLGLAEPRLAAALFPAYRDRRVEIIASTAAHEVFSHMAGAPAVHGQPADFVADPELARTAARAAVRDRLPGRPACGW